MVIALSSFEANRPTQMSFAKGDTIEVVAAVGKWHTGILVKSSKYPITKETLMYPSNFCKPRSAAARPKPSLMNSVQRTTSSWSHPKAAVKLVEAKSAFAARKPSQMSFAKGDLIEVVKEEGKWHVGILRKSTTCEITGKKLYYPSNYVLSN